MARHVCGYTPFRVRLDNLTNVQPGKQTLVAVYADPDNGDAGGVDHASGWWYEGGGLYRHVHLVRTSSVHVAQDGLFAYSNISWSKAAAADSAVVHVSAEVFNGGDASRSVCVSFVLTPPADGAEQTLTPLAAAVAPLSVPAGGSAAASASIAVAKPLLWSAATPHLYTIRATVSEAKGTTTCGGDAEPLDSVSTTHGFRSLRYDANTGFFLNREHFKVRGFCDHNTFAVVGMAVPERVQLFRAQALRAIGGNGRRTSHNPPDVSMLDLYDRVGVVVMDENRLFANKSAYVANMGALVKRDRNHPSVVIWSFCNEAGCEGSHETGGPRFRAISYDLDGSRPTLANMFTFGDLLSNTIDVQGFSHQTREKLDDCHAKLPTKPIYMSECCSCNTMRDEDEGCETKYDNPHNKCIQKAFNARCTESNAATNASDGAGYAVGTMVWTLFDYYGEPPVGGLEVSSTYGQYDLVGFPKAAAFWYRTQWLLAIKDGPDKPFATFGKHEVHIVESWESPDAFPSTRGARNRSVHAYTSAPSVELQVNGRSVGTRAVTKMVDGPGSYAEWLTVPWEAGTITAIARDADGEAVASSTRHTNGAADSLTLTIDAPSKATGTGEALLADAQDAALLRASVVDAAGRVMHLSSANVSFRVLSGPGVVVGAHNGDPHSKHPCDATWHPAYHGLVRAVVRVTSAAARPAREVELMGRIDAHGPMSTQPEAKARARGLRSFLCTMPAAWYRRWDRSGRCQQAAADASLEIEAADIATSPMEIVVEASSPGFAPAIVSIPVSTDVATAGVMAVAAATAGRPVDFFGQGA